MKNVVKLEELGLFILSFLLFRQSDISWWWYLVLILAPDISIAGYLLGAKTGARIYNIFHHRGLAVLLLAVGYYSGIDILYVSGVIMFGHASMDRIFGYGLKYERGFKYTHLGEINN